MKTLRELIEGKVLGELKVSHPAWREGRYFLPLYIDDARNRVFGTMQDGVYTTFCCDHEDLELYQEEVPTTRLYAYAYKHFVGDWTLTKFFFEDDEDFKKSTYYDDSPLSCQFKKISSLYIDVERPAVELAQPLVQPKVLRVGDIYSQDGVDYRIESIDAANGLVYGRRLDG